MGQRDLRRVPLTFDWPHHKVWGGYIRPENLAEKPCEACDGTGNSPYSRTSPLTVDTPEVRAFAERNVANTPGESAIVREARRLVRLWNGMWSHHLDQDDVDVLVDGNRLHDFTHRFVRGEGWQKIDPPPTVTAEQVNRWSLKGMAHDSINAWVVISAKCRRAGQPEGCDRCEGYGSIERYPGQRAEAEAWEWTEPPTGDGYQLWETTSEGSPVSPVFATAEELASWCVTGADMGFGYRATYEQWLSSFQNGTTDIDSTLIVTTHEA